MTKAPALVTAVLSGVLAIGMSSPALAAPLGSPAVSVAARAAAPAAPRLWTSASAR
jgi:hypothetical protein